MKTPIVEYLETKTAAMPEMGKKMLGMAGQAAMGAGVAAGVGAGVAGLGAAASKIYDAITKKHDFSMMLEHNDDLVEHFQSDPKKFNQMYSSLRAMSPQFSKDPLVAGSYMRRMLDNANPGGVLTDAYNLTNRAPHPTRDVWNKGVLEGAKAGIPRYGQGE